MRRVLKIFLLWLLIAALPAQGMAVAIQGTCCLTRQAEAAAMMPHLHHEMEAMAQHAEHAAMHGHDADAQETANDSPDQASPHPHQHKTSSCGSCAACYGAIAPPGEVRSPAPPGFKAVDLSSCVPITGHVPASLERPPKQLSV